MSKHFTFSLLGVAAVVFVGYILLAGSPITRIDHACAPIGWIGKAVTAMGDIGSARLGGTLANGARNTEQGCRFIVFKTFYADEYRRMLAAARKKQQAAGGKDTDGARAAAPASAGQPQ